jgi:hypothetical protein
LSHSTSLKIKSKNSWCVAQWEALVYHELGSGFNPQHCKINKYDSLII